MSSPQRDFTMPVITVVGIFVLTLLLYATTFPIPNNTCKPAPVQAPIVQDTGFSPYNGSEHLFVIDQPRAEYVELLSTSLKEKGYVVIKDVETDEVIGVSRLLDPGLYTGGAVNITKPLVGGQKLVARIFTDDGNGTFGKEDKRTNISSAFSVLSEAEAE